MADEKHTNSSPQEQIRDESSSKESPQASGKTAAWFQRLMRVSIWEKEEPAPSKVPSSGKGITSHRDPTADAAIANVMREEKRKEKDKHREAENRKADNRKEDDRKGGEENA